MSSLIREPLYQQIVDLLRQEITEGRYLPGSRFSSERELASRFQISRTTANKVLSMLLASSHLQYKKGVGAFLAAKPLEHDMSMLFSFTEQAKRLGIVPETKVLVFKDDYHEEIGRVLYLERLRSVDGVPVIYEKRWLSVPLCSGLTPEMAGGSLYEALKEKLNIEVACAEQCAGAISPGKQEQSLLQIKQSCACLRVIGKGFLKDGNVIWAENTLFRGDRYEIHGILCSGGTSTNHMILDRK